MYDAFLVRDFLLIKAKHFSSFLEVRGAHVKRRISSLYSKVIWVEVPSCYITLKRVDEAGKHTRSEYVSEYAAYTEYTEGSGTVATVVVVEAAMSTLSCRGRWFVFLDA